MPKWEVTYKDSVTKEETTVVVTADSSKDAFDQVESGAQRVTKVERA